jgi:anaerobic ribonucleoside-triphosphate reductase activating protein
MSNKVGISRVHFPITALGPGRRIGIWFQGCSIRCDGCMSRDTWAVARRKMTVSELLYRVQPWLDEANGITISGGEPFEQPEALMELLEGLRTAADTNVIAYSGSSLEQLIERHPSILEHIDLLISEPFDSMKAVSAPLFGSANQRATCLTKRGAEIWHIAEAAWRDRGGRLDLIAEADGPIWVAGVPGPGDLERLGTRLRRAGITPLTSAGRLGEST